MFVLCDSVVPVGLFTVVSEVVENDVFCIMDVVSSVVEIVVVAALVIGSGSVVAVALVVASGSVVVFRSVVSVF